MKIALIGPSELTEFDKKEVWDNIHDFISKGNDIIILAYRSIEIEVFKYFVENIENTDDNITSRLHIYTLQPLEFLPQKIQIPIEFLVENGANYHSFGIRDMLIKRPMYTEVWEKILHNCDLLIGFNDGEEKNLKKIFIPIDIAKSMGVKAVIYQLPKTNQEIFLLEPESKIRVIE